jgi:hypothetical protein
LLDPAFLIGVELDFIWQKIRELDCVADWRDLPPCNLLPRHRQSGCELLRRYRQSAADASPRRCHHTYAPAQIGRTTFTVSKSLRVAKGEHLTSELTVRGDYIQPSKSNSQAMKDAPRAPVRRFVRHRHHLE